jgi:hypothetical protein
MLGPKFWNKYMIKTYDDIIHNKKERLNISTAL